MENSMRSSTAKSIKETKEEEEESGWTSYFDDFSNVNKRESSSCSGFLSNSTTPYWNVPDAASSSSSACKNLSKRCHNNIMSADELIKLPKRLSAMKSSRTQKKIFVDDDDKSLEDTASSPVNSPKGTKREAKNIGERGERRMMSFNGKGEEYTDLKKRGLCLFPVSMLLNHLG